MPRVKAETKPVLSIVATEVLPLLHVPLVVASLRSELVPIQRDVCPVIPCTTGSAFTVIFCVFLLVHPFAAAVVYVIIVVPFIKPDTTPELFTDPTEGWEDDHVPPVGLEFKVIVAPTHTLFGPEIEGTAGKAFIVKFAVLFELTAVAHPTSETSVMVTVVAPTFDAKAVNVPVFPLTVIVAKLFEDTVAPVKSYLTL